jgi:hypothetical protein
MAGRLSEAPRRVEVFGIGPVDVSAPPEDRRNQIRTSAWIDRTGRFRLDLSAGSYLFRAAVPGFAFSDLRIVLLPGENRELTIGMSRGGAVTGTVLSTDGRPAPGVMSRANGPRDFSIPRSPSSPHR